MQSSSFYQSPSFCVSVIKKLKLLRALASVDFSGKIIWQDNENTQWTCLYEHGRLLYATGGKHILRRWHRNLQHQKFSPEVDSMLSRLELLSDSSLELLDHQEYLQICALIKTGELTQDQAVNLVQGILDEVLLDIFLADISAYKIIKSKSPWPLPLPILIDERPLFQKTFQLWETWKKSNLNHYSPDQAPVIRKPEKMREKINRQLYQVLTTLLDGRHTLRDVALKTNRDVIQITQALKMFIQLGWINLLEIPDYAPAIDTVNAKSAIKAASDVVEPRRDWGLIACVDDSPLVCQTMEKIIRMEGYQFVSILDARRAIPTLLSKKPDMIFLDLVMPHTNGYEICSQLRRVSKFSHIPIIILSGNDGVVDQVRARLMGATDFVSKPVDATIISNTIEQYLEKSAPVYQTIP